MVAFNFADTTEAKDFKLIVDEKIYIRRRRDGRRVFILHVLAIIWDSFAKA
jgi:hypothetical protein